MIYSHLRKDSFSIIYEINIKLFSLLLIIWPSQISTPKSLRYMCVYIHYMDYQKL